MTDNLAIWSTLAKTNPAHTKKFVRGGGFKGTAVKPIYTDQKMTEMFGPCGVGWGITEPTYQLVTATNGEVAVYCWLAVWYAHEGKPSDPIPGIGGDFAIKMTKNGLVTDDEAFKKAATDAIGNAMKHIGMSADIHMGQHDDDKYVAALQRELREEEAPKTNGATKPPHNAQVVAALDAISDWNTVVNDIIAEIAKTKTVADLAALYGDHQQRMAKAPAEMKQRVLAIGKRHHEDLMKKLPAMAAG